MAGPDKQDVPTDPVTRIKTRIAPSCCFLMIGLLSACATAPTGDEKRAPSSRLAYPAAVHAGQPPSPILAHTALVVAGGRVQISYRDGDREAAVSGVFPSAGAEHGTATDALAPGFIPPIIQFEPTPAEMLRRDADVESVSVRSVEDWHELIHRMETEIAALVPNQGVVLDVLRQEEIFLYVNEQGQLRAVPIEDKPRGIRPAKVVTLTELLKDAAARVRRSLQSESPRYLLFNTGDIPDTGFPFVFMDLQQGQVFFMQRRPDSAEVSTHGPAGAAQATLHAIGSQVESMTGRPVSSFARLILSLGTTAMDTVYLAPDWERGSSPVAVRADARWMDSEAWEHELDRLTGGSSTFGQIRYLVDGAAFFPALIHALNDAEQSVRMRLYIFDNDDYALKIADLLKRRSKDVPVRILLDGFGTIAGGMAAPEYTPQHAPTAPFSIAEYLRADSDIHVRMLSNPWMQGDHTKVIIIDRQSAFLGGMNIGREYRYEWHDLMVELQGPVIDQLIRDFENTWVHAGFLGDLQAPLRRATNPVRQAAAGDYPLRLLYTQAADSQILRAQIAAMRRAQGRIWIQNAYLTSDAVIYEMVKARRRGVDVRVVLPYQSDAGFIDRSNALAANLMLRHGIRVYIYPGMSHLKAAVYDGWACLGSANFDRLSLRLNKETNIASSHPAAVEQLVDLVFAPDFERAVELTEPLPASWLDYLKELIADHL